MTKECVPNDRNVVGELPTGSLSVAERERTLAFPSERAGLRRLAFQRAVDNYNDKWPANEGVARRSICEHCDQIFEMARAGQKYCADADTVRYRQRRPGTRSAVSRTKTPVRRDISPRLTSTFATLSVSLRATCEHCGHEFRPKRSTARFCTDRCRLRQHRRRAR